MLKCSINKHAFERIEEEINCRIDHREEFIQTEFFEDPREGGAYKFVEQGHAGVGKSAV